MGKEIRVNRNDDNVTTLPTHGRSGETNGSGRNGGGFRLGELERRVGVLEQKVEEAKGICIELKTRVENLATKEDVLQAKNSMLMWGVGIIIVMLVSVVGHVFLRSS